MSPLEPSILSHLARHSGRCEEYKAPVRKGSSSFSNDFLRVAIEHDCFERGPCVASNCWASLGSEFRVVGSVVDGIVEYNVDCVWPMDSDSWCGVLRHEIQKSSGIDGCAVHDNLFHYKHRHLLEFPAEKRGTETGLRQSTSNRRRKWVGITNISIPKESPENVPSCRVP